MLREAVEYYKFVLRMLCVMYFVKSVAVRDLRSCDAVK